MANQYVKRSSTFLLMREMLIKTTRRYHLTLSLLLTRPPSSGSLWRKHMGGFCPLAATGGQASPLGSWTSKEPTGPSIFSNAWSTGTSPFHRDWN